MNADELAITFYSVKDLINPKGWKSLYEELGQQLKGDLSRLDTNDPVRNTVSSVRQAAAFTCDFGEKEGSRRLFGRFGNTRADIAISLFKDPTRFPNQVSISYPLAQLSDPVDLESVTEICSIVIKHLKPFYGYCDRRTVIAGKRKRSGFSVDLQAELVGVFWLTYFGNEYVEYFGREKFDNLPAETSELETGVLIRLGDSPSSTGVEPAVIEESLGKESVVDPDAVMDKLIGQHALRFSELVA